MIKKIGVVLLSLSLFGLVIVACGPKGKNENKNKGRTERTRTPYKSNNDEGTISGKVTYSGQPPAPRKLDMGAEPQCASKDPGAVADDIVVKDGKVANAFVYLKGGPADRNSFDIAPGEKVLDQSGCRYHPHVMGIQTSQTLKITNSDPVSHNIHPKPNTNPEWNESQSPGAGAKEKTFDRAEILVPVKCDIHPWMKAWIAVMSHPFYAVTAEDGTYTLKGVPPGDYTLVVYHETFGEKTFPVNVAAKGTATKDAEYSAGSAYVPTSLKIGPALVLP
jgi:plastocyanin